MQAVITGDIIQSRKSSSKIWLTALKKTLNSFGTMGKDWEIYRGDSFQLLLPAKFALLASIQIKASIKQFKNLDVRIGIGIGTVTYRGKKVTESNGTAFIYSGECFDQIKKQTIVLKSPWNDFNTIMNLMLDLARLSMDKWTENVAEIVLNKFKNPLMNQTQLADKLKKKSQGAISEGLRRGAYEELKKLLDLYQQSITPK